MADEAFCKRLLALRLGQSWTITEISRITGLTERSCIAYERGETPPSYKFLIGLRDAGVDIAGLLGAPVREPHPLELAESVITKAAQYKATLDAISALLATMSGSKARILSDEEEFILASYRSATPRDKTLFKTLCPAPDNSSTGTEP